MGDFGVAGRTGRRAILLGLASGVLAAVTTCSSADTAAIEPVALSDEHGDPAVLAPPVPNGPEASAAPSQVPAATAAAVPLPSKAQLVTEFDGRRPTEWGLGVTGVVTRSPGSHTVLTFDACGGPGGSGVDQELLATLRRLNIPATLFVNARWIQSNRQVAAELAHDPLFELANHGWQHRPLSVTGKSAYGIPGTRNVADVYDELTGCADVFREVTGHKPRFFRSGTAYFDEVAAAMSRRLGMLPVNFSINADAGATLAPAAVASAVATARPGDIVIAHFNKPGGGTAAGFRQALPQLKGGGTTFARLGDVLPAL
ncbi:polysaccharide deacetylase family protein [Pseudarthrobacter sp. S3]|uniref:polysaccharide deacetylase family protein n=1 Tax=unclassified Pseudarthrobacter TaxID=2647000 RepID=UPI003CED6D32